MNVIMKKLIIALLAIAFCITLIFGCAVFISANTAHTEANQYAKQETHDYFRCVYEEGNIQLWVNTLDNSVWIAYNAKGITPYTINGKTVFWQGSMEETFAYTNIK